MKQKFPEDDFFNHNVKDLFEQAFKRCFVKYFGAVSVDSLKFYSHYQNGFITYHSISCSNRKGSSSYNVSIMDQTSARGSITTEIIFFFKFNNENFVFFKNLMLSDLKFSSFIHTDDRIYEWNNYIDYYYYFVNTSSSLFGISSCTNIKRKCLLLLFDNKFTLCTDIELELAYD